MTKENRRTRSPNGAGHIYQRKDGRWEGRMVVGKDFTTGQYKRKSVYGNSYAEVQKKLVHIAVAIGNGDYIERNDITIGEWLDVWVDTYVKPRVKIKTYEKYLSLIKLHILPHIGGESLQKMAPVKMQNYYNFLLNEKGVSPCQIKNIHGVLHSAYKKAFMLEMVRKNPTEYCDLPKRIKPDIHPMETAQIIEFLNAVKGHKYESVFVLTLFTGLRQGEVLALSWDCVNFDKSTIRINKQLIKDVHASKYVLAPTKSSQTRIITVAPTVLNLIKGEKARQEKQREKSGERWNNEMNLVFTNEFGGHLCHGTVYNNYKKVVRSLGMDEARFHDLRHSFAVMCIENGDDIKTIQSNLGHATSSFTLDVYGHVSQTMQQQSAMRMEKYIQSLGKGS